MCQYFLDHSAGHWAIAILETNRYGLTRNADYDTVVSVPDPAWSGSDGAQCVRFGANAGRWLLIAGEGCTGVSINGVPLLTGARVLRHQDEIRTRDGVHAFFSTERLPKVEPFPGIAGREVRCPVCKLPLQAGEAAVQCPGDRCALWYHATDGGRDCWFRGATCAMCKHPTDLNGQLRWTPEVL